jgi:hypothetical protein
VVFRQAGRKARGHQSSLATPLLVPAAAYSLAFFYPPTTPSKTRKPPQAGNPSTPFRVAPSLPPPCATPKHRHCCNFGGYFPYHLTLFHRHSLSTPGPCRTTEFLPPTPAVAGSLHAPRARKRQALYPHFNKLTTYGSSGSVCSDAPSGLPSPGNTSALSSLPHVFFGDWFTYTFSLSRTDTLSNWHIESLYGAFS